MPPSARPPRVSRKQWVDAASDAFRTSGLAGVRIEAVARALGVTKGSFYWHFDDRRALVNAVVERWETEQTEDVIARAAADGDARERLTTLFHEVAARTAGRGGERHLYLEAAAEGVQDAVRRVTARRVEHVEELLRDAGLPPDVARARAVVALAAAVGVDQLHDALPPRTPRAALVQAALGMALAPTDRPDDLPRAREEDHPRAGGRGVDRHGVSTS